jgi:fatty-acid peroxygenase
MLTDDLGLLLQGYAFLPNRRRASGRRTLELSLLGKRAVAGLGPQWVRRFYDERYVERSSALPGLVKNTLVGQGAVHTLDGSAHRHRKQFFLQSFDHGGASSLGVEAELAWDRAERRWRDRDEIVLFPEAAHLLLEAVWRWAGLPGTGTAAGAADMVAMVDAFGSVGPRNLRGRRARGRQESRVGRIVRAVRRGREEAPPGSVLDAAVHLTHEDGSPLDEHTAAVEILNVVRPTVATAWFLAFAAHALDRAPGLRADLASGDPVAARAFAHELRRFYPFAPFVGGTTVTDADWDGVPVGEGDLVLLDIYGQHHDPDLWRRPYRFDPSRFAGPDPDPWTLVAQGGGLVEHGHRCPGEPGVVSILERLLPRLAAFSYAMPRQDDRIPLSRIPTRPRSGMVLQPL